MSGEWQIAPGREDYGRYIFFNCCLLYIFLDVLMILAFLSCFSDQNIYIYIHLRYKNILFFQVKSILLKKI